MCEGWWGHSRTFAILVLRARLGQQARQQPGLGIGRSFFIALARHRTDSHTCAHTPGRISIVGLAVGSELPWARRTSGEGETSFTRSQSEAH